MKTKKTLKALIGIFLSFIFSTNIFASFYISVENGFAGKSTIIETSTIGENISAKISIEKPNGEKIFINEKTGKDGKISSEILGYHTKKAGVYNVEVQTEDGNFSESNFIIYPSKFSSEKSEIFSSEKSIAVNIDTTDIFAKIVDRYGNPIKGQKIKLLSSRTSDVFNSDCVTDVNGKCVFEIKGKEEGTSVFTAINISENKILEQRVKIIFYTEEEKFAAGGNPFMASLLDVNSVGLLDSSYEFGVVDSFKIETSDEIILNSDDNKMVISAIDKDGNVVKDYLGDIQIVIPNDENAVIPGDGKYSFTKEDQGIHEFSLSTVFTRSGKNKIEVYELNNGDINSDIKGIKNLNVEEKKLDSVSFNEKDLKIISPSNGTRIGNNSLQISGKGTPFTDLKIYINEKKEGDLIPVDKDGIFSAKINGLTEGQNFIHVTENQGSKRSSQEVEIFIDTTAPILTDLEVFPQEIESEESFNLKIYSEKGLDTIKALVNGNIEVLKEVIGTQGVYEVNVTGPTEAGVYPIDVILSDSMGNKETYRNQGELKVKEKIKLPADKIDMIDTTVDGNKIQLKWQVPESQNEIKNYEIYLGESEKSLKLFGNSKVNDVNIENLKYETKYFIGIKSENEFGKLSEMSDIKSVLIGKDPNKKVEEKPVEHGSAITDIFKKDNLVGFAGNSRATLKWSDLGDDSVKYKIEYGISKDFLQESILTKDNVNTWYVEDLINGLDYYFKVYGVDENGVQVSKESNILKLTPNGKSQLKYGGFVDKSNYKIDNIDKVVISKNGKNVKSGPEIYFLLAIALLIGDFMHRKFFSRREKI